MKNLVDKNSFLDFDTDLEIITCKWCPNGNLAICGNLIEDNSKRSTIDFYSNNGIHIRSLEQDTNVIITSLCWSGNGLNLAYSCQKYVIFVNIQPKYQWEYFNETLVFAYGKHDSQEVTLAFYDTKAGIKKKQVKNMAGCVKLVAYDQYFALLSTNSKEKIQSCVNYEVNIKLFDSDGKEVDSKQIGILPGYSAMNSTHLILASRDVVYCWQFRSSKLQLWSLKQGLKRKQIAFHIDDEPNNNLFYDRDTWVNPKKEEVQDFIWQIAACDKAFVVGRQDGIVNVYNLVEADDNKTMNVILYRKIQLTCRPDQMQMNCDGTAFSILDVCSRFTICDIEKENESEPGRKGLHLPYSENDAWSVIWAKDDPKMCALMIRNRLYLCQDFKIGAPEKTYEFGGEFGYLCDFQNLKVRSVIMEDIMQNPEAHNSEIKDNIVDYNILQGKAEDCSYVDT